MSRKSVSSWLVGSLLGSLVAAGLALSVVQGCGSSSSTGSTETFQQVCVKEAMCLADASTATATKDCATPASGTGGQSGTTTTCTNASTIESDTSACLKISDCTQFQACLAGIPACAGGTGGTSGATGGVSGATGGTSGATGGTSGATGGTSGAAGGSGSASCSSCDKAQTCCMAGESLGIPASDCTFSAAKCNGMTGTNQTAYVTMCQEILAEGVSLNVSACK
jgi:hypothetical protein